MFIDVERNSRVEVEIVKVRDSVWPKGSFNNWFLITGDHSAKILTGDFLNHAATTTITYNCDSVC